MYRFLLLEFKSDHHQIQTSSPIELIRNTISDIVLKISRDLKNTTQNIQTDIKTPTDTFALRLYYANINSIGLIILEDLFSKLYIALKNNFALTPVKNFEKVIETETIWHRLQKNWKVFLFTVIGCIYLSYFVLAIFDSTKVQQMLNSTLTKEIMMLLVTLETQFSNDLTDVDKKLIRKLEHELEMYTTTALTQISKPSFGDEFKQCVEEYYRIEKSSNVFQKILIWFKAFFVVCFDKIGKIMRDTVFIQILMYPILLLTYTFKLQPLEELIKKISPNIPYTHDLKSLTTSSVK